MISITMLERVTNALSHRIHQLEVREPPPPARSTVALLGSAAPAGRIRYVTNGRKTGEGVGAGTGTLAYSDGTAWRRVSDDTTVAA